MSNKNSLEILLEEEKRTNNFYQEKIRDLEVSINEKCQWCDHCLIQNVQEVLKTSLKKEKDSYFADKQKAENDQATLK